MTPPILRQPIPMGKAPLRPYAKLPHDLAADPRLLPIDVRLLLALVFFARDKDHCWPSDKTLGERIGRARPTVQRRLRHLEALGLVRREKSDANPTARSIRLTWRAVTRETPPVSAPVASPRSPVRHESEPGGKDSFASQDGGGSPPSARPVAIPMTPEEIAELHAASGWLSRPQGDPLRRLAERRLAEALQAPQEGLGSVVPVTAAIPSAQAGRPAGAAPRRSWRPTAGPRPLFG